MGITVNFLPLPSWRDEVVYRPLVDVVIAGLEEAPQRCLVDTGAVGNRFDHGLALHAGVELNGEPERLGLGGHQIECWTVTLPLKFNHWEWEAPVSFCKPWTTEFNLLGQEGFLRWFRLTMESVNRTMTFDWMDEVTGRRYRRS